MSGFTPVQDRERSRRDDYFPSRDRRERLRKEDRSASRDRRRDDDHEDDRPRERKRRGMWDVDAEGNQVAGSAGVGAGGGGSGGMMMGGASGMGGAVSAAAVATTVNPLAQMQQQAMMTALLQQQAAMTRRARRLHVGNLPPGLSPDALKELINTTMQAAKLALNEVHTHAHRCVHTQDIVSSMPCP